MTMASKIRLSIKFKLCIPNLNFLDNVILGVIIIFLVHRFNIFDTARNFPSSVVFLIILIRKLTSYV